MKKFETPAMEIQKFEVEDVITTSEPFNPDISGEGNED